MSHTVQNPPDFTRTGLCKACGFQDGRYRRTELNAARSISGTRAKKYCHSLKDVSGLSFFLDLILVFLADVQAVVGNMVKTLRPSDVDFNEMHTHYVKLKGSSSWCNSALNCINHEYNILNDQLDIIIKIEQEIVTRSSL
ncbi:hypothetical protein CASFOL_011696 [Castilleja foliolosa]|uniref:Uncharacterized protein n=1 Tax=Castilleja foliolosa TaxID=1961234 RepID=A0ABD3DXJ3_9LAMI